MRQVKYNCKENDNHLIFTFEKPELPDEIDEILIGDCLEKSWIIIGFNDLKSALKKVGYKLETINK